MMVKGKQIEDEVRILKVGQSSAHPDTLELRDEVLDNEKFQKEESSESEKGWIKELKDPTKGDLSTVWSKDIEEDGEGDASSTKVKAIQPTYKYCTFSLESVLTLEALNHL